MPPNIARRVAEQGKTRDAGLPPPPEDWFCGEVKTLMFSDRMTRRVLMTRTAGLASWATLAGLLLATPAAAGSAPYPTRSQGRLMPREAPDYEKCHDVGRPRQGWNTRH